MGGQEVGIINCEYCATAFEVVSPLFNRRVKMILLSGLLGAHGHIRRWMQCPKCHSTLAVNWYYYPEEAPTRDHAP